MTNPPSNIILSRTDSIGDMVLTLPMAKALKDVFPNIHVAILGRAYTRAIVESCNYVDSFIDFEDFMKTDIKIDGELPQAIVHVKPESYVAKRAKKLNIALRIGTTNRLYHWFTCNRLVALSRKQSNLHEAQLNLKLLKPFGIRKRFTYADISEMYGLENTQPLPAPFASLPDKNKYNIIVHPKSRGNAREWGVENYISLISLLDPSKYKIFVSGTEGEKQAIQPLLEVVSDRVTDITGKLSLPEFLSFVNACDGLIACSTGPLHMAAALGKDAYGIYPPIKPMHPGRWAPIGKKAEVFVANRNCNDCRNNSDACHCIKEILPAMINDELHKNRATLFDGRKHFEAE